MKQNTVDGITARLVPDGTGCLLLPGAAKSGSYRYVSYHGRIWLLHKLLWEAANGPVPAGLQLDHLCHNRRCGNIDHLDPVTQSENLRRGVTSAARLICKHGHALSFSNVYLDARGSRHCILCRRAHKAKARRARGAFVKATTTHCRRGHPYPADLLERDIRFCRVCGCAKQKAYQGRKKLKQTGPQLSGLPLPSRRCQ